LPDKRSTVVFMFPGQGSQYVNMCRDLYEHELSFSKAVDECLHIVDLLSGKDLKSVIFGEHDAAPLLDQTEYTQPALFIIEYALAQTLIGLGYNPDVMIGHSIGEYVAACLSGVFSLEDALRVVLKRGELMQGTSPGSMLSVSAPEKTLRSLLHDFSDVNLAAVNSSDLCVVSGSHEGIKRFQETTEEAGFNTRLLRTSHAFHGHMMDEILTGYEAVVSKVKTGSIGIPFI